MNQSVLCGRRGLDELNAADKLIIGALRLWKLLRVENAATLPGLHGRLAPVGGDMLAVPLDDFFKQVAAWCICPHGSRIRHSDQLSCDEVATLDLLHAACSSELHTGCSEWNGSSLRTLSAYVLGLQFAIELKLRF
eukprot:TRINITY_DN19490_c0_g1_i12.p1 TRINITY_DN19490_c0_g1~~TRINITY_DN19490_c0_g1_i12.p1  ORF type:complete len:136 (+),score=3.70 TRINITY_DN19490_c0_g1_i12:202-609(+)